MFIVGISLHFLLWPTVAHALVWLLKEGCVRRSVEQGQIQESCIAQHCISGEHIKGEFQSFSTYSSTAQAHSDLSVLIFWSNFILSPRSKNQQNDLTSGGRISTVFGLYIIKMSPQMLCSITRHFKTQHCSVRVSKWIKKAVKTDCFLEQPHTGLFTWAVNKPLCGCFDKDTVLTTFLFIWRHTVHATAVCLHWWCRTGCMVTFWPCSDAKNTVKNSAPMA